MLLALSSGAGRGELLGLRWRDVDFEAGRAILYDSKNKEPRTLTLVKSVRDVLVEHAKIRRIDSQLVLPSATNPGEAQQIYKYWWTALRAADISDFRFHDLRHSCASYLAMNGGSAVEIADVLGHKTFQMVKRYSHLADQHKADLLERVAGKLFRLGLPP